MTASKLILGITLALCAGLAAASAVPVTIAPARDVLIDLEVRAPAQVIAANEAVLTAQISALVKAVHADVGATVKAGDVLIELDDDNARLALQQARASLDALDAQIAQARQRLDHGEELFKRKFIADDELLERRTTLSVLVANRAEQDVAVRTADLNLRRTRITAPFPATVVARQAQVGSLAMPGTALIKVVQSDHREVEADLDPRYSAGLVSADDLRLVSQGKEWPLSLLRLSPVIDSASRIQKGRFGFSGERAPVGATGEVVWRDASGLIPVPLIVQRDGKLGVFVATDGKARFVRIPDAQEGRPAPAATLPHDANVVTRGQARLQDGDELTIAR